MKVFKAMCEDVKGKKIKLEADAQEAFLSGLLLIEKEEYQEGLQEMLKSKAILTELQNTVGTIQKAHILEKVEQIDNNIRFCRYQLNEFGSNYDDILEMKRALHSDPTYAEQLEELTKKMETENPVDKESLMVKLFGKDIEIQNEHLIATLKEIEVIEKEIGKLSVDEKKEKILGDYIEIFNLYDDAIKTANKELNAEGISEAVQKIWKDISLFFTSEKNIAFLKRNKILINQTIKKFVNEKGFETIFFHGKSEYNATKPQNIVKLLDLNLAVVTQLKDSAMDAQAGYKVFEVLETYYRTDRMFYVACYHISQANHLYALSLLRNLKGQLKLLEGDLEEAGEFDQREEIVNDLENIGKQSKILRIKSHLTLLEIEQKNMEELPDEFEEMEIEEGKKIKKTESIFDIVVNNESKVKSNKGSLRPFVKFPPEPKLLPTNPILLDISYSQLEYPDIQGKIKEEKKEEKKGGFFSRFNIWGS